MDFKEKRNFKRLLYSKFTIIILSIVIVFLSHAVWGVYKKAKISYRGKVKVQSRLESLKHRETALVSGIGKLNSSRGIESEIRERFGVVKEGEELVVIVDEKNYELNSVTDDGISSGIINSLLVFVGIR